SRSGGERGHYVTRDGFRAAQRSRRKEAVRQWPDREIDRRAVDGCPHLVRAILDANDGIGVEGDVGAEGVEAYRGFGDVTHQVAMPGRVPHGQHQPSAPFTRRPDTSPDKEGQI